jgi:hypothetical protein
LVEKTAEALPGGGRWRVYYLGFSRSGWSQSAPAIAEGLAGSFEGWEVVGAELVDLDQVAQDLTNWTA